MKIEDIKKNIEQCKLSIKDVDELLLEVSWIEHPDLIRELLAYKSEPTKAAATVKTEEEIKNEWKTEKLSDGTLKLVSYKGTDEVVEIPEMIGKAKVSELGDFVLAMKKPRIKKEMKEARARIKSVIIGDFIKKIGASAFEGCEGLEQVSLPQGITELPEKCFAGCIKIKEFVIPETVKKMGDGVFCGCESIESITLSPALTEIPPITFAGCFKLKAIDLGSSIKKIGYAAFRRCEALSEILIPAGVTNFSGSKKYQYWSSGAETFSGCKKLKKVILPETMTKISESTFEDCENLVDINIPKELVSIQYCAFRNCRKLADLTIPETVTKISDSQIWGGPFSGCKKLTLHVKADSFAEKYAKKNEINYVEE